MIDKPTRGLQDWDGPLNEALGQLEADATVKAEQARLAAIASVSAQVAASRDRSTHTGLQDISTITGLPAAVQAQLTADVVRTSGAQSIAGVKTFAAIPVVPDASFGVIKVAASGTRDATTFLRGDGVWSVPAGTAAGTGSTSGSNALGTLSNPVTDSTAARPTGLTRVVWDTPTDPVNWAVNDFNLQKGS